MALHTNGRIFGGGKSDRRVVRTFVLALALASMPCIASFAQQGENVTTTTENTSVAIPAAKTVILSADGTQTELQTPALTVGDLLKAQEILLGKQDRCSCPLNTPLTDGMNVTVTRIRTEKTTERFPIAFATKEKYSPSLSVGKKKIIQAGKLGERVKTFAVTYKDGEEVKRVKVGETIAAKPQTQYVMVGTRGMTLASRGYFSGRRMIEMRASAYGPNGNGQWGARTASGLRPGHGVVAVDPRFIPLGTRLYIEGYGYAVAGDTGGAIKGDRVDLGYDSNRAAWNFGRQKVRVLILD